MGAVTYKTGAEWVSDLQRYIGAEVSLANPKFPADVCIDALMEAAWEWMPWLPRHMVDNNVETLLQNNVWPSGTAKVNLPSFCARAVGFSMSGPNPRNYHVELFGFTTESTYNDFIFRKTNLHREALGIRLVCLIGKGLLMWPVPTETFLYDIVYRYRIRRPDELTEEVQIPMEAAGFVKAAAAETLLHSDHRSPQALAIQQRFVDNLKTVFGIKTMTVDEPERSK